MSDDKERSTAVEQKPKVYIEDLGLEVDEEILGETEGEPTQEEPEDAGQPSPIEGQPPDEFKQRFINKSPDELIKIIHDSQKQIGELGKRVGDTKKELKSEFDEIKEQKDSVESSLKKLKQKLEDEYDEEYDKDDDEFQKLQKEIKKKESRLRELTDKEQEAKTAEMIQRQMHKQYNESFLANEKTKLTEELGMQSIDSDTWDAIENLSVQIAGIGAKITGEDVRAATIKVIGAQNYAKIVSGMAQAKVRSSIANAHARTTPTLAGTSAGTLTVDKMSEEQLDNLLRHYWEKDREAYEKLAEKIRNRGI